MVKPLRDGKKDLANQYEKILTTSSGISIIEISNEIALKAAGLRATHNLRTPDALQFATALAYKTDYFLTNDNRLKSIEQVQSLLLPEL